MDFGKPISRVEKHQLFAIVGFEKLQDVSHMENEAELAFK
jgi:hypothetical protein